jgi:hypothetical protein
VNTISKYPKAVLKGETQGYTIYKYPKAVLKGETQLRTLTAFGYLYIMYPCVSPLRTAFG